MNQFFALPEQITGSDLQIYRQQHHMSIRMFSSFLKISPSTLKRWENENVKISGPVCVIYKFLFENPELLEYYAVPHAQLPKRMWYMFCDTPCTVIDIDEKNKTIKIKNFTKRNQYRAFGINAEPTYEEYLEFIESRCFPRTRDKMKLQLAHLGIPFYDPFLIIQKTKGRMAEDDFWLKME